MFFNITLFTHYIRPRCKNTTKYLPNAYIIYRKCYQFYIELNLDKPPTGKPSGNNRLAIGYLPHAER